MCPVLSVLVLIMMQFLFLLEIINLLSRNYVNLEKIMLLLMMMCIVTSNSVFKLLCSSVRTYAKVSTFHFCMSSTYSAPCLQPNPVVLLLEHYYSCTSLPVLLSEDAYTVYKQVKDRSNAAVYIVVESRLGQFPVKFKASGKKQAPSKGNNVEAVQDGLDKESYELLAKILGSSLDGLK